MKNKDCTQCLFARSISNHTKAVSCHLSKAIEQLTCKDYISKNDLPTWEEITRKNEVEQIAFSFGSFVEPENLSTERTKIVAYVKERKKNLKPKKEQVTLTPQELDFFNYGIKQG